MREKMMSRLALLLCTVGAICNASVITTAGDARVASRELFHYYDIDTSMSFPCPSSKSKSLKGKGLPPPPPPPHAKGKKGTKHPKGCKEPPPPKLPKSSKSYPIPGKGKGIATPTKAPTPTKPTQTASPNGNIPIPPSPVASPTAPTSSGNTTDVTASPFTIAYTISTADIPTTSDYDGLAAMTAAYLEQIFAAASTSETVFLTSTTTITNQSFVLNQPVLIGWSSVLSFGPGTVPSMQEVDDLISASFTTNSDGYQAQLAALTSNIFSTTMSFNFTSSAPPPVMSQEEQPQTTTLSATQTAGIAAAAGAGAFLLLIGGIMIHRKRQGEEDEDEDGNEVRKDDGHMTVAGDTYAGTLSMDSGARQSSDEEGAGPIERSEWEAYAKYSTAEYRNTSPNSSGNESDGSDGSDERLDLSPRTRRTLDDVDI